MKKFLYAWTLILPLCIGCNPDLSQNGVISGCLSGIDSDTIIITSFLFGERTPLISDTVALKDGHFLSNFPDTVFQNIIIQAKPKMHNNAQSVPAVSMSAIQCALLPNSTITIAGTLSSFKVNGNLPFYDELEAFNDSAKLYLDSIGYLNTKYLKLSKQNNNPDLLQENIEIQSAFYQQYMKAHINYIIQYPDNNLSLYLLTKIPIEQGGTFLNQLSERVKTGALASVYKKYEQLYKEELIMRETKNKVRPGSLIADFTLSDVNGKKLTLSSLKGKYVILDFWGSWCSWCLEGFPRMKKYYEKYKSKIEIVGIACGDSDSNWRNSIAKNELPWINVIDNGKESVVTLYAISGFPTKIILDTQGRIIEIFVGENPEFYTMLDELCK
ncbi:MAG: TlpA disulfide reductase family protein [Bacteroides sp.]|uniref:peroxiredoxin family protein n=1 Tax=Bacteroides sp. TaxID=29523 RepID=UPI002FCC8FB3